MAAELKNVKVWLIEHKVKERNDFNYSYPQMDQIRTFHLELVIMNRTLQYDMQTEPVKNVNRDFTISDETLLEVANQLKITQYHEWASR